MSRRTLVVIVAVVVGGLAAFALSQYVGSVEDEAYGNARRVEVLIVKQDIAKGTSGADALRDGSVATTLIPQEFRPATALTAEAGLESLVARSDLSANQVLVDGMFVTPERAFASNAERIPDGRVAITIDVDQVKGVAGLIVPGDRVNMIIGLRAETAGEAAPEGGAQDGGGAESDDLIGSTFMYQNVEVLAVGSQLTPDLGEEPVEGEEGQAPAELVNTNLVTLSVPPEAALKVAYMESDGEDNEGFYLTLVPPGNEAVDVPPASDDNLLDDLTPYPDEEAL